MTFLQIFFEIGEDQNVFLTRSGFVQILTCLQHVHKHGISAADLQRILGFGSYETAWAWLHKIRRAMVRENRDKLNGCAQTDETFVGGKGASKEIVVIAAEEFGRVRLMHAPGNHTECLEHLASNEIDSETTVKTDGHAGYNEKSLGERDHCAQVQTKAERRKNDLVIGPLQISNAGFWAPIMAPSARSICSPISMNISSATIAVKPKASVALSPAPSKTCSHSHH